MQSGCIYQVSSLENLLFFTHFSHSCFKKVLNKQCNELKESRTLSQIQGLPVSEIQPQLFCENTKEQCKELNNHDFQVGLSTAPKVEFRKLTNVTPIRSKSVCYLLVWILRGHQNN
jgi:hypothetical protein